MFEKRVKSAEARYADRLNDMRKQLDTRWRQIDRFETSLKGAAEQKAIWRKKLSAREGEVEALKVCIYCCLWRNPSLHGLSCKGNNY